MENSPVLIYTGRRESSSGTSLRDNSIAANMLALTSLLFATNAIHAWARSAYVYSFILLALTVTSYLLHTSDKQELYNNPLFWFDQVAILMLLCIYVYYTSALPVNAQIVSYLALGIVIMLYYGGYATGSCCFDESNECSLFSHSCMHIVGSIGNHFVIAVS